MELEQMLEHTPISATDSGVYNTIDAYMAEPGLYSGMPTGIGSGIPMAPGSSPYVDVSRPVFKSYADHENKLIGPEGITGVYSKFGQDSLELDIFSEELGEHHRNKSILKPSIEIPYIDIFKD